MADQSTCAHDGMYWYAAPHNERGWKCVDCGLQPGEEPGYSPQHDRDLIRMKCWCILHDMVDANLVSVSNSDHGESLASSAARIARDQRTFDQESIVAILGKLCAGDGSYWRKLHEGILGGNDPRDRCHCGKVARQWHGGKPFCSFECDPDSFFNEVSQPSDEWTVFVDVWRGIGWSFATEENLMEEMEALS